MSHSSWLMMAPMRRCNRRLISAIKALAPANATGQQILLLGIALALYGFVGTEGIEAAAKAPMCQDAPPSTDDRE